MNHCRDHDPLLRAGCQTCPRCHRRGYPVDAAWLNDQLILVSYGPLCEHYPGTATTVTNVTQIERRTAPMRCAGLRKDGRPCGAYAIRGLPWCSAHGGRQAAR